MNDSTQVAVGFGLADITPDHPIQLAGIDGVRLGRSVLDPLHVRALHVAHGGNRLVLVAIDTLYVSRNLCHLLQEWVQREHGISPENVFVAATHTHCAPLLLDTFQGGVPLDEAYFDLVLEKSHLAIAEALDARIPATIACGVGAAEVSINRRAKRLDRTQLKQFRSTPIMANRPNARGSVDNFVRCIRFETLAAGVPDIVLVSAGCHPSIIRSEVYSADFPGLIGKRLKDLTGQSAHTIFVQGFSGDTRAQLLETAPFAAWPPGKAFEWLFDRHRFRKNSLDEDAVWAAFGIAEAVAAAVMVPVTKPKLSAKASEVCLSLDPNPGRSEVSLGVREWALAEDVRLLGLEGEIFSDYARWLVTELQEQQGLTVPVSCVGGMVGYVPTAAALPEGGYEVDRSRPLFGLPTRFTPDVEQKLKDSLLALVTA